MTSSNIAKLKKFIKSPLIFFRDYLNKKYPIVNNELLISEFEEENIIKSDLDYIKSIKLNNNIDIDIVFTWVDNKDPKWILKLNNAQKTAKSPRGLYADDPARFDNHNELYYSLTSIKLFLPWINNIFIITDNQIPSWFHSIQNKNIFIIDHKQIIDEKYLPTFNSHVIEANLHNIPGLNKYFIYFNDDVFVARNLPKSHFFRANGISSIFVSKKTLTTMVEKGVMTPTLKASLNCQCLLEAKYGKKIENSLVHTYVPLRKDIYELAWRLYRNEITAFLSNKFRSNNDLNLATFLVPWLMYLESYSVPTIDICYYFNIRSMNAPNQYLRLLQRCGKNNAPHSFCANDFHSNTFISDYQKKLITMLDSYFKLSGE